MKYNYKSRVVLLFLHSLIKTIINRSFSKKTGTKSKSTLQNMTFKKQLDSHLINRNIPSIWKNYFLFQSAFDAGKSLIINKKWKLYRDTSISILWKEYNLFLVK